MRRAAFTLLLALFSIAPATAAAAAQPVPAGWLTRAERSDFEATSSYEETMAFLHRVSGASPAIHVDFFGSSAAGRPLPLVVASADGITNPEQAVGRTVVLVIACIHAGEVDGKDAATMLLRDLALGREAGMPREVVLLVAPIYNADGHEKVSPHNRPNQNGPRMGMGYRTNAARLDLNRDHLKLASPEARALIGLFNDWRPHLVVDTHVTNGSEHGWVLTWSWAEAPQVAPSVDGWMRRSLPPVLAATEAAGFPCGPYVELVDGLDPSRGTDSSVAEPRYSSGYFPLRHRPTVLIEMHAHQPYGTRVAALRHFLGTLLDEVRRDPQALRRAVGQAEAATVAAGGGDAESSEVVLRWETDPKSDTIRLPLAGFRRVASIVTGAEMIEYGAGPAEPIQVPWYHRQRAVLTVPRPRGYVVLPGWPQIEARLAGHALRVERFEGPVELDLETLRAEKPVFDTHSYQGQVRVETEVLRSRERRLVPAGSLWVPADQPDFEVAVQLLEPEAPDSLLSWGLLDSVLERTEYIDPRVLERFARAALMEPGIRDAWSVALGDPAFAGDPGRRYLWWYRRTPSWDRDLGLLPVMRRLEPLPSGTERAPWKPRVPH